MIKVYVREDLELKGLFLGEFAPYDLCEMVGRFKEFDTFVMASENLCHFDLAQFVSDGDSCYFEIVVKED
jgi:hypothetical protein